MSVYDLKRHKKTKELGSITHLSTVPKIGYEHVGVHMPKKKEAQLRASIDLKVKT